MKIARHSAILKLIKEQNIETQTELVEKLNEAGFDVAQATISRDIRALKLTKAPLENGRVHYVASLSSAHKYLRVFKESVVSITPAKNLLVIKTIPGMAMAAAASLDGWETEKIIGCIAGDDTIFCALASEEDALEIKKELDEAIEND